MGSRELIPALVVPMLEDTVIVASAGLELPLGGQSGSQVS